MPRKPAAGSVKLFSVSDDGGKTWFQPGTPAGEPTTTPEGMPKGESNKFVYDTSEETGAPLTTHQFYDGSQKPGSLSEFGTSNLHFTRLTRSTQELKTRTLQINQRWANLE
jgi:hypothetical protein